uniref:Uncharacterized protein n=1 Tax=Avena sativa TaxID=4498 RepID=A0ACD5YBS2_AVESA
MSDVMNQGNEEPRLELPPGFRFHPTDEEVVSHYLTPKVLDRFFSCLVIADVDLNKCEPWDLPSKAKMGEKEWYFFVHKDRKYPTGMRTNRATESGYWKATGKDKEIFRGKGRAAVLVGMKKTLVFYLGRAPRGEKTPWVMHEYRLDGKLPPHLPRSAKDEWAVCRVFNKDLLAKNAPQAVAPAPGGGMERIDSLSFLDDLLLDTAGMPALMDSPFGATDDDLNGASTSTSGAAVPLEQEHMGYHMVKTEQPAAPPQETQSPYYFSMPAATSGARGGAGYAQQYHQAAGNNQQDAIRRHCRPDAPSSSTLLLGGETDMPSLLLPSSRQSSSYLDLEELCSEPLMDYSNMWKF